MEEYTEKIHAQRVLKMFLYRIDICNHCPAGAGYKGDMLIHRWNNSSCGVCLNFVQVRRCPCIALGKRRAIIATAESLKTKGYVIGKIAVKNLDDRVNYLKEGR